MRLHERGLARAVRIPAALSSSVKELENELGIEIFTRSSQGIALTVDGAEFLTYARQVLDQASLLEERYKNAKPRKQLCSVSTQHYMFAVEAFVEMIDSTKSDEYEFTIRETRTKDIINRVANMLSEIGIIYLSDFNKDVIGKLLREKHSSSIRCSARRCTCSSRATIRWPARRRSPWTI